MNELRLGTYADSGTRIEQGEMPKNGYESAVRRLTDGTDKLIQEAHQLTNDLERMLEGALSPSKPVGGTAIDKTSEPHIGSSPLAQRIEGFNNQLMELCDRLRYIASRIEV